MFLPQATITSFFLEFFKFLLVFLFLWPFNLYIEYFERSYFSFAI